MFDARFSKTHRQQIKMPKGMFDKWLVLAAVGLVLIGLTMVASCSIVISEKQFHQPFHYLIRQSIFLGVGIVMAFITLRIEMSTWIKFSFPLLALSFILVVLVLIPGIGHSVNGSIRWLGYGFMRIQVSEVAKLALIFYVASYVTRYQKEVQTEVSGFLKPLAVIGLFSIFLLREPDFGAVVVILLTSLGILFIAGVRLWQFACLLLATASVVAIVAVSSPYRIARLTSFIDPWARQYDSGYQLTQSLIAFGRGGLSGVGLGGSIQKLFYLPEAHTDFLFAVLAEEFGLIGCAVVVALFSLLVWRALLIGRRAISADCLFPGYTAIGLGLLFALQATVNIGVNAGLLPTKGLTLPLMSYGGSSMLINVIMIALLLRIDFETRRKNLALFY